MSGGFAMRMGGRSDAFSHAHSVFVDHGSTPRAVSTTRLSEGTPGVQTTYSPTSITTEDFGERQHAFFEKIASGTVEFAATEKPSNDLEAPPFASPIELLVSFAATRREEALCMSWCIKFAARSSRAVALAEGAGDDESALRFACACIAHVATPSARVPQGHTTTLTLLAFVSAQWPILRAECAFGGALVAHAPALRHELCERALDCARRIVDRKSTRSKVELFTLLAAADAPTGVRSCAGPLTTLTCIAARSGAPCSVDVAADADSVLFEEEGEEERILSLGVASAVRDLSSAATCLLAAFATAGVEMARTKTMAEMQTRDVGRPFGSKRGKRFSAVARDALVACIDGSAAALSTLRAQARIATLTAALSTPASAHPGSACAAHDAVQSVSALLSSWSDALHASSSAHALSETAPPPMQKSNKKTTAPTIYRKVAAEPSAEDEHLSPPAPRQSPFPDLIKETGSADDAPAPATPTSPRGSKQQRRRRPTNRAYAKRRQRASRARRARAQAACRIADATAETAIFDAATKDAAYLALMQHMLAEDERQTCAKNLMEDLENLMEDLEWLRVNEALAHRSFESGMSLEEGMRKNEELCAQISELETLKEALQAIPDVEQVAGDPLKLLTTTLDKAVAQQAGEIQQASAAERILAGVGWSTRHEIPVCVI